MCNLRLWGVLFGIAFVAAGVMGYMPAFVPDGKLFGIFEVDSMHNMVHAGSGIVALLAAAASVAYCRLYFRVFGIVYGIVAIAGFLLAGNLMVMHVNMADNYLHLGIAIVSLYLGFFCKRSE